MAICHLRFPDRLRMCSAERPAAEPPAACAAGRRARERCRWR